MNPLLDITPGTKVGALLDMYPALEEVLIATAPEFRKLRNPVLRKTVGKVATLARAAKMAGLDPVALANRLRAAAGLEPLPGEATAPDSPERPPAWVDEVRVRCTVEAERLLDAGEHPLDHARRAAAALEPGEAVVVRAAFRPVPLEEALAKDANLRVASRRTAEGWETVVARV